MTIEDRIYEKSVEYLSDIPELADEKPSKLLIGFVTEKFKQCRNYPPSFTDAKIESDMEKHLNTIAMAVVDLKAKEGARERQAIVKIQSAVLMKMLMFQVRYLMTCFRMFIFYRRLCVTILLM